MSETILESNLLDDEVQFLSDSYENQKIFYNEFFENLKDNSVDPIPILKRFSLYTEIFRIPFAELLNNQDYCNKLSLYIEEGSNFREMVKEFIQTIFQVMSFLDKPFCFMKEIQKIAEILDIDAKDYGGAIYQGVIEKVYVRIIEFSNAFDQFKKKLNDNSLLQEKEISSLCNDINKFVNEDLSEINFGEQEFIYGYLSEKKSLLQDMRKELLNKFQAISIKNFDGVQHINQANPNKISNHIKKSSFDINKSELIEIHKRTSFYLNERLRYEENDKIEYKNYSYPLCSNLRETICNQICGFLNSKGGRIYFGIDDSCQVKGMKINLKQRDLFRNDLINLTRSFFPSCRTYKFKVDYIPVLKSENSKNYVLNLYVCKLIISQGDYNKLYSISKDCYISYKRLQGQVVKLNSEEIMNEIITRERKGVVEMEGEDEFCNDPQPDIPIENPVIDYIPEFSKKSSKNMANSKIQVYQPKKLQSSQLPLKEQILAFPVTLRNIPKSLTQIEFFDLIKDCNFKTEQFFTDKNTNKCLGCAYFSFISSKDQDAFLVRIKKLNKDFLLNISASKK